MEFIITLAIKFWQWTILIAVVIIGWLINVLDKRRPNKLKFTIVAAALSFFLGLIIALTKEHLDNI